jgi:hypothetical protein
MKLHVILLLSLAVSPGNAGERTSANYTITAETADAGGLRATSANYTHDGSATAVGGLSSAAPPAQMVKHGYLGQLFDITGLVINGAAPNVNETETLQLGAWYLLDDATYLTVAPELVTWQVVSGPIESISAVGIATAGSVYQDTAATVQGTLGAFIAPLDLTVLDSIADNFGSYAGDGIGDDWQVFYFGFDNPLAAPALDPDGDGQDNLFEFTAGLVPTDPFSLFRLWIECVPNQPAQKRLVFNPRFANRTYTVEYRMSLIAGDWAPLEGTSFTDNGNTRTLTDPNAVPAPKFYRVRITKP